MNYSIGEVAKLTNLSRDMIRYYEKQGAIKASRNTENNYRTYDTMEVFWLFEAIQHKSWGIPIPKITEIRNNEYTTNTVEFLDERINELETDISYLTILRDRLEKIKEVTALSIRNIGNFWVTQIPATYRTPMVKAIGDEYEKMAISKSTSEIVFSEKMLPFLDNTLTVTQNVIDWEFSFQATYIDLLNQSLNSDFYYEPKTLALCTHVDIGEIGSFDASCFNVLTDYAKNHNYDVKKDAKIRGNLLGRGIEDGKFRRIVRVFLPIN